MAKNNIVVLLIGFKNKIFLVKFEFEGNFWQRGK